MATLYPTCISDGEICNLCYVDQASPDCSQRCQGYCISGCNTTCRSKQTFCDAFSIETVIDHADISAWPYNCYVKDEFIFRNWRSSMWNGRLAELREAINLGVKCSQSETSGAAPCQQAGTTTPDPTNTPHPAGSLVTAAQYNQMVRRINYFNKSLGTVKGAAEVGCENADVIRGTHAMALYNGFNTMKFNKDVCDVCNTGSQHRTQSCNCNSTCDCYCDCNCYNSGQS